MAVNDDGVERIEIYLGNGDDLALILPFVTVPVRIEAGDGNDDLTGGLGNDLLLGGAGDDDILGGLGNDVLVGDGGDDELVGGLGRDILIGGLGADSLNSGSDEDILVGGTTSFDADGDALLALLAEWSSSRSLAEREANLRSGNGPLLGDTDRRFVKGTTVFDDGEADVLNGTSGVDWLFFLLSEDELRGKAEKAN
jgi:Ca2+-binding RTX toxin-like protein